MSVYCLIAYIESVGKVNATVEGLKAWKSKNWIE